jgi:diguanylate cyclase (GGDEF)-like protein/putative nucleotidyltransferase with HDIG domain
MLKTAGATAAVAALPSVDELIAEGREAENAGRPAEARALYERALESLPSPEALVASKLFRWIALTHLADGEADAGIGAARRAVAVAEAHADDDGASRALNVLGVLHQSQGELDGALAAYRTAEARSRTLSDPRLRAMIQMNLATIANIRGQYEEALAQYERSLVGFREVGAEQYIGYVLNNLGMLYTDLGRWPEGERAFSAALASCERAGDLATRVMVQVNLAELLLETSRIDAAEALCTSAWQALITLEDRRPTGELARVHGAVLRERGDLQGADAQLQLAARIAGERGDLLLLAEVLREQAMLFSLQDRNRETLTCLNRSHQLFQQLRARRDISDLGSKIVGLEQTFLRIVRRWGESIESADLYTQGHCVRVADYACTLARAAGFDTQTLLWFRMGALLHDVGKIVIPADVLNKPGSFTAEERRLMERHPDAGVELLRGIEFPWDIAPMVRFHHERWGGGGYPTGAAGERIPLSARILAIADVFDALTTDRPYRSAYSMRQAMDIMSTSMAGHFDPQLLDLWSRLVKRGEIDLPVGPEEGAGATAERAVGLTAVLIGERFAPAELGTFAARWSGVVRVVPAASELSLGIADPRDLASAVVVAAVRGTSDECVESVVRAREQFGELPLVALVERENEDLALRLIQHGAQDCIVAGSTDAYLLERTVRRAIARGRLQSELQVQSLRDDLSGLNNRRGFFALGLRRLKTLRRGAEAPLVLFIDLDGLKGINDGFGHCEGDRALIEVAGVLRGCFRETDVLGRIGGDEFAVLTSAGTEETREKLAVRVEEAIARRNRELGRRYELSVSIGFAAVQHDDEAALVHALDSADRAMYARKYGRRGKLHLTA